MDFPERILLHSAESDRGKRTNWLSLVPSANSKWYIFGWTRISPKGPRSMRKYNVIGFAAFDFKISWKINKVIWVIVAGKQDDTVMGCIHQCPLHFLTNSESKWWSIYPNFNLVIPVLQRSNGYFLGLILCLFVCLFVCLCVCLFVCLFVRSFVRSIFLPFVLFRFAFASVCFCLEFFVFILLMCHTKSILPVGWIRTKKRLSGHINHYKRIWTHQLCYIYITWSKITTPENGLIWHTFIDTAAISPSQRYSYSRSCVCSTIVDHDSNSWTT